MNNFTPPSHTIKKLNQMAQTTQWRSLWNEDQLSVVVNDLKKSGLTPELCQEARLIPLTFFLRQMDETTARGFIKSITGLSSSKVGGKDLLKDCELLAFPYFSKDGDILFVRLRSYPPLVFKDENGKDREVKYLQPKGTPAVPYILPGVWDTSKKPHKPIWLTEGEKKALSLMQHGRYAIALSGVWNFRAGEGTARKEGDLYLWHELEEFTWMGRVVYLGFDQDLWFNPQVRMALFELGLKLMGKGAVVRVPLWDRKLKGIDDFLSQHPEELERIEEEAKKLTDMVREEDLQSVVRALAKVELSYELQEQLYRALAKKLLVKPDTLERAVWRALQKPQEDAPAFSEEVLKEAQEVLKGNVVGRLWEDCKNLYAGREKEKLLLYLTVMSRKVKGLPQNLMVVLRGNSSEGKSALARAVLSLINTDEIIEISYQSRTFLYYGVNDLSNKVLFLTEFEGSTRGLYGLKLALTEGELLIRSVEATPQGLRPINRRIPAYSMATITTGVNPRLDDEMETRSIALTLSSDEELRHNALKVKALKDPKEKERVRTLWKAIDYLLEPAEVVIPWMADFVEAMKGRLKEGRYLRDFDKFIALVKASALIHQHQRQRDEEGRIIAQKEDYELVYSLQELFTETFGGLAEEVKAVMDVFFEKAHIDETHGDLRASRWVVIKELAKRTKRSERTILRWIERAVQDELLQVAGRGKKAILIGLVDDPEELPKFEFPFPEPEKIFKPAGGDGGCVKEEAQKEDTQAVNTQTTSLSHYIEAVKQACEEVKGLQVEIKEEKGLLHVYNGQSNPLLTIDPYEHENPEALKTYIRDYLKELSEKRTEPEPETKTETEPEPEPEPLEEWKPLIKPDSLRHIPINTSNLGQLRQDLHILTRAIPPKWGLSYDLQGFVLTLYLSHNNRVVNTIQLNISQLENLGQLWEAILQKLQGKEDSTGGKEDSTATQNGSTDGELEEKQRVGVYLTHLGTAFKELKRQYGQRAEAMTYYYNSHKKEWELIKGNESVLKLPVANGLSVEACLQKLREGFERALTTSEDPLMDF